MDEYLFRPSDGAHKRRSRRNSEDKIHYLLRAEEQILQSISGSMPLPELLNGICSALDFQIGNMVSLISLQDGDTTHPAAVAGSAALFGLHTFHSAAVLAEDDELLGFLEMYCCVPRSPSAREFQLIERATCLAAIAIKRHYKAGHQGNGCIQGNRPVRSHVLEWPVSMN